MSKAGLALKEYRKNASKEIAQNLSRLKRSVQEWNEWREQQRGDLPFLFKPAGPLLSHSDLRGWNLVGAELSGADLQSSDLRGANLSEARLRAAHLSGTDLRGVKAVWTAFSQSHLWSTNLSGANLRGADLRGAEFTNAILVRTNLKSANIKGTYFIGTDFTRADLSWASLGSTVLADCTLRTVKGLAGCLHEGPSFVDYHTLAKSGRMPADFLRECGLGNTYISELPRLLHEQAPLRCFISYSVRNERFVEKLDADLHKRDVRSWYFRKHALWGENLLEDIDSEIMRCDKVILVCSKDAMNSLAVLKEIDLTLKREKETGRKILIPIRLDEYVVSGWTDRRKKSITDRNIGSFTGWSRDEALYDGAFEHLFETLHRKSKAKRSS